MLSLAVATVNFSNAIRAFSEKTGKELRVVVKEQALLLAQRLTKFTFPASASQGKRRVSIDVGRVYLKNSWFEEIFQFTHKKLGERVIDLVRRKDEGALRAVFERTKRLRLVRVEPFDPQQIERMRRNGRVLVPNPRSLPLSQQSQVNALERRKKANVGLAKSGWAQAVAALGKSVPAWLGKSGTGSVADNTDAKSPSITLTNSVPWFRQLDDKANIVQRALEGRAAAMAKSADKQIELAAKAAGL